MSDPEKIPAEAGTTSSAGRLLEGFVRDWVTNGVVLLSLVVVAAGLIEGTGAWRIVAPVVALAVAVLAFASIRRRWPVGRTWLVLLGAVVVDLVLLVVVLTG